MYGSKKQRSIRTVLTAHGAQKQHVLSTFTQIVFCTYSFQKHFGEKTFFETLPLRSVHRLNVLLTHCG